MSLEDRLSTAVFLAASGALHFGYYARRHHGHALYERYGDAIAAFRVPAPTRFAVEVEHGTSARTAPSSTISLTRRPVR